MPHTGPILEGVGNTDYERYIRTVELLSLQKDVSELANPDERLFQITHQAAELWLKEIDYEVDRIAASMNERKLDRATDLLHRCKLILELLRDQIVILETMDPVDYHAFRVRSLGRGSGQESPGFNRILDAGKRMWVPFEEVMKERGLTPLDVEREPRKHYDLHRLIQAMLDYDSTFMKWRFVHLRLALRIIGGRVMSLKNVPVTQLEGGTREPLFPKLWEMISDLTDEFRPTY